MFARSKPDGGIVSIGSAVTIENPNGVGSIVYTLDGSVPDLQHGEMREVAFEVRLPTGEHYQATVSVVGDPAGNAGLRGAAGRGFQSRQRLYPAAGRDGQHGWDGAV